jgi:hypothetical protein
MSLLAAICLVIPADPCSNHSPLTVALFAKPMKLSATIALCLLPGCFLPAARGQTAADWLQSPRGFQRAVIPIYSGPEQRLSAVVRVDKSYTDFEKHGFFRISALPVAVLDGVTFEIKDSAPAAQTLARVGQWLGVDAGNHLELRQVKVVGSAGRVLEGARAVFQGHDRWKFTGGVRLLSGANETKADSATLQVSGNLAGQVLLQPSPPGADIFLFRNPAPALTAAANLNSSPNSK